jgi:hypothetical protein
MRRILALIFCVALLGTGPQDDLSDVNDTSKCGFQYGHVMDQPAVWLSRVRVLGSTAYITVLGAGLHTKMTKVARRADEAPEPVLLYVKFDDGPGFSTDAEPAAPSGVSFVFANLSPGRHRFAYALTGFHLLGKIEQGAACFTVD